MTGLETWYHPEECLSGFGLHQTGLPGVMRVYSAVTPLAAELSADYGVSP